MSATLELRRIHSWVSLGFTPGERKIPQEVEVDLVLHFPDVPSACRTDRLEETINYAELCEKVDQVCRSREFALIERLCGALEEALLPSLGDRVRLGVQVHKLRPPVENLRGGAWFRISPGSSP